jgi:hypothetical protein
LTTRTESPRSWLKPMPCCTSAVSFSTSSVGQRRAGGLALGVGADVRWFTTTAACRRRTVPVALRVTRTVLSTSKRSWSRTSRPAVAVAAPAAPHPAAAAEAPLIGRGGRHRRLVAGAPGTPLGVAARRPASILRCAAARTAAGVASPWLGLNSSAVDSRLREVDLGGDGGAQVVAADHRFQQVHHALQVAGSTSFR